MKKKSVFIENIKKTLSFYYGFVFPGTSSMALNFVALRVNSFGLQACIKLSLQSVHSGNSVMQISIPQSFLLTEDSINIHLGVHGGATKFLLEQCGYNCKTFSIPDMRGNVFKNECVDEECQFDMSLETCINTTIILQHLKQQHTIAISQDPGRYICNYMYYKTRFELVKIFREAWTFDNQYFNGYSNMKPEYIRRHSSLLNENRLIEFDVQ